MSPALEHRPAGAASPGRGIAPEQLPAFPPRSAADLAAEQARRGKYRLQTSRRRRGFPIGLAVAVAIAAGGAGVVVSLDPLSPPAPAELVRVVASADAGTPVLTAVLPAEAAGLAVTHTGALTAAAPLPAMGVLRVAEATVVPAAAPPPGPPEPEAAAVPAPPNTTAQPAPVELPQVPRPTVLVSIEPPAREMPAVAPQAQPAVAAPPAASVKPAELNGLVARGEQFLKAGDLASARLFFGRAAAAGDPRGARGMAQTFDPAVVRQLPVYGLAVDSVEAERWYERARGLSSEKAMVSR